MSNESKSKNESNNSNNISLQQSSDDRMVFEQTVRVVSRLRRSNRVYQQKVRLFAQVLQDHVCAIQRLASLPSPPEPQPQVPGSEQLALESYHYAQERMQFAQLASLVGCYRETLEMIVQSDDYGKSIARLRQWIKWHCELDMSHQSSLFNQVLQKMQQN